MAGLLLVAFSAQAAVITVNALPSGSGCTLVDAIDSANVDTGINGCAPVSQGIFGRDLILIPAKYSKQTFLSYDAPAVDGKSALPNITSDITITGIGQRANLSRSESISSLFRIFHIASGGKLTLNNISVENGVANNNNIGITEPDFGGAIFNRGTLNLNQSVIQANQGILGGGIYNFAGATLVLDQTTVSENLGAGIYNSGGSLTVTDSFFRQNNAGSGSGGAIVNTAGGTANIRRSSFYANQGSSGGAIWSASILSVKDSTFSGNQSNNTGGAIQASSGSMTIINATISENSANKGGGIGMGNGTLKLVNALVSGNLLVGLNTQGSELYSAAGTISENRNNLIGHSGVNIATAVANFNITGVANIVATSNGAAPAALTSILKPKQITASSVYYPLPDSSPAIDAAATTFVVSLLPLEGCFVPKLFPAVSFFRDDQLGNRRPEGTACDIGAYEFQETRFFAIPLENGKTVIFGL